MFKPFKEQHSHNTRGARGYVLNIPKMKTSFCGSRSVQVKSIKDWNYIIDKILKISGNAFRLTKKQKIPFREKTTLITVLDNLNYYVSSFI